MDRGLAQTSRLSCFDLNCPHWRWVVRYNPTSPFVMQPTELTGRCLLPLLALCARQASLSPLHPPLSTPSVVCGPTDQSHSIGCLVSLMLSSAPVGALICRLYGVRGRSFSSAVSWTRWHGCGAAAAAATAAICRCSTCIAATGPHSWWYPLASCYSGCSVVLAKQRGAIISPA